jgi:glycosidase/glycosyltransferase involved in cell wall biosynthesis
VGIEKPAGVLWDLICLAFAGEPWPEVATADLQPLVPIYQTFARHMTQHAADARAAGAELLAAAISQTGQAAFAQAAALADALDAGSQGAQKQADNLIQDIADIEDTEFRIATMMAISAVLIFATGGLGMLPSRFLGELFGVVAKDFLGLGTRLLGRQVLDTEAPALLRGALGLGEKAAAAAARSEPGLARQLAKSFLVDGLLRQGPGMVVPDIVTMAHSGKWDVNRIWSDFATGVLAAPLTHAPSAMLRRLAEHLGMNKLADGGLLSKTLLGSANGAVNGLPTVVMMPLAGQTVQAFQGHDVTLGSLMQAEHDQFVPGLAMTVGRGFFLHQAERFGHAIGQTERAEGLRDSIVDKIVIRDPARIGDTTRMATGLSDGRVVDQPTESSDSSIGEPTVRTDEGSVTEASRSAEPTAASATIGSDAIARPGGEGARIDRRPEPSRASTNGARPDSISSEAAKRETTTDSERHSARPVEDKPTELLEAAPSEGQRHDSRSDPGRDRASGPVDDPGRPPVAAPEHASPMPDQPRLTDHPADTRHPADTNPTADRHSATRPDAPHGTEANQPTHSIDHAEVSSQAGDHAGDRRAGDEPVADPGKPPHDGPHDHPHDHPSDRGHDRSTEPDRGAADERIKDAGQKVDLTHEEDLKTWLAQNAEMLGTADPTALKHLFLEGTELERFGALHEMIRKQQGFSLRDQQLAAARQGMLDGKHVDMKAGQGKSDVFKLAAGVFAADRGAAHLMTSHDLLADRDAESLRAVLEPLGIKVERFDPDRVYPRTDEKVVYVGTVADFAFAYLRGHWEPRGVAAVDEIDSALVDQALNAFTLSEGAARVALKRIRDQAYWAHDVVAKGVLDESHFELVDSDHGRRARLTPEGIARIAEHTGDVLNARGIARLEDAATARWGVTADRHYIAHDGKIIIIEQVMHQVMVDPETGLETRWNGLAQALEAQHGMRVRADSAHAKTVTAAELFKKFDLVVGASGTANGAERALGLYGDQGITEVPRFADSKLVRREDIVAATEAEKIDRMVHEVVTAHETGRPVLLVTEHNDQVRVIADRLRADHGLENVVSVDARSMLDAGADRQHYLEGVWDRAGHTDAITVSSKVAGRGVDIMLSAEAKELGGLHAVVGFRSEQSGRIDEQAMFRAARSDDPGSATFVVAAHDFADPRVRDAALAVVEATGTDRYADAVRDYENAVDRMQTEGENSIFERLRDQLAERSPTDPGLVGAGLVAHASIETDHASAQGHVGPSAAAAQAEPPASVPAAAPPSTVDSPDGTGANPPGRVIHRGGDPLHTQVAGSRPTDPAQAHPPSRSDPSTPDTGGRPARVPAGVAAARANLDVLPPGELPPDRRQGFEARPLQQSMVERLTSALSGRDANQYLRDQAVALEAPRSEARRLLLDQYADSLREAEETFRQAREAYGHVAWTEPGQAVGPEVTELRRAFVQAQAERDSAAWLVEHVKADSSLDPGLWSLLSSDDSATRRKHDQLVRRAAPRRGTDPRRYVPVLSSVRARPDLSGWTETCVPVSAAAFRAYHGQAYGARLGTAYGLPELEAELKTPLLGLVDGSEWFGPEVAQRRLDDAQGALTVAQAAWHRAVHQRAPSDVRDRAGAAVGSAEALVAQRTSEVQQAEAELAARLSSAGVTKQANRQAVQTKVDKALSDITAAVMNTEEVKPARAAVDQAEKRFRDAPAGAVTAAMLRELRRTRAALAKAERRAHGRWVFVVLTMADGSSHMGSLMNHEGELRNIGGQHGRVDGHTDGSGVVAVEVLGMADRERPLAAFADATVGRHSSYHELELSPAQLHHVAPAEWDAALDRIRTAPAAPSDPPDDHRLHALFDNLSIIAEATDGLARMARRRRGWFDATTKGGLDVLAGARLGPTKSGNAAEARLVGDPAHPTVLITIDPNAGVDGVDAFSARSINEWLDSERVARMVAGQLTVVAHQLDMIVPLRRELAAAKTNLASTLHPALRSQADTALSAALDAFGTPRDNAAHVAAAQALTDAATALQAQAHRMDATTTAIELRRLAGAVQRAAEELGRPPALRRAFGVPDRLSLQDQAAITEWRVAQRLLDRRPPGWIGPLDGSRLHRQRTAWLRRAAIRLGLDVTAEARDQRLALLRSSGAQDVAESAGAHGEAPGLAARMPTTIDHKWLDDTMSAPETADAVGAKAIRRIAPGVYDVRLDGEDHLTVEGRLPGGDPAGADVSSTPVDRVMYLEAKGDIRRARPELVARLAKTVAVHRQGVETGRSADDIGAEAAAGRLGPDVLTRGALGGGVGEQPDLSLADDGPVAWIRAFSQDHPRPTWVQRRLLREFLYEHGLLRTSPDYARKIDSIRRNGPDGEALANYVEQNNGYRPAMRHLGEAGRPRDRLRIPAFDSSDLPTLVATLNNVERRMGSSRTFELRGNLIEVIHFDRERIAVTFETDDSLADTHVLPVHGRRPDSLVVRLPAGLDRFRGQAALAKGLYAADAPSPASAWESGLAAVLALRQQHLADAPSGTKRLIKQDLIAELAELARRNHDPAMLPAFVRPTARQWEAARAMAASLPHSQDEESRARIGRGEPEPSRVPGRGPYRTHSFVDQGTMGLVNSGLAFSHGQGIERAAVPALYAAAQALAIARQIRQGDAGAEQAEQGRRAEVLVEREHRGEQRKAETAQALDAAIRPLLEALGLDLPPVEAGRREDADLWSVRASDPSSGRTSYKLQLSASLFWTAVAMIQPFAYYGADQQWLMAIATAATAFAYWFTSAGAAQWFSAIQVAERGKQTADNEVLGLQVERQRGVVLPARAHEVLSSLIGQVTRDPTLVAPARAAIRRRQADEWASRAVSARRANRSPQFGQNLAFRAMSMIPASLVGAGLALLGGGPTALVASTAQLVTGAVNSAFGAVVLTTFDNWEEHAIDQRARQQSRTAVVASRQQLERDFSALLDVAWPLVAATLGLAPDTPRPRIAGESLGSDAVMAQALAALMPPILKTFVLTGILPGVIEGGLQYGLGLAVAQRPLDKATSDLIEDTAANTGLNSLTGPAGAWLFNLRKAKLQAAQEFYRALEPLVAADEQVAAAFRRVRDQLAELTSAGPPGAVRPTGWRRGDLGRKLIRTDQVAQRLGWRWERLTGEIPDAATAAQLDEYAREIGQARAERVRAHKVLTARRDALERQLDQARTDLLAARRVGEENVAEPEEKFENLGAAVRAERTHVAEIERDVFRHDQGLWRWLNPGSEPHPGVTDDLLATIGPGFGRPGGLIRPHDVHQELVESLVPKDPKEFRPLPYTDAEIWGYALNNFMRDLEPGRDVNCVATVAAHVWTRLGWPMAAGARMIDAMTLAHGDVRALGGQVDGPAWLQDQFDAEIKAVLGPRELADDMFQDRLSPGFDLIEDRLKQLAERTSGHATAIPFVTWANRSGGHAFVIEYDEERGFRYYDWDRGGLLPGRPAFSPGAVYALDSVFLDGNGQDGGVPGAERGYVVRAGLRPAGAPDPAAASAEAEPLLDVAARLDELELDTPAATLRLVASADRIDPGAVRVLAGRLAELAGQLAEDASPLRLLLGGPDLMRDRDDAADRAAARQVADAATELTALADRLAPPAPGGALVPFDFALEPGRGNWTGLSIQQAITDRGFPGDSVARQQRIDAMGEPVDPTIDPYDPTDPNSFLGGDLPGLTEGLDYVRDLGIDALWISPVARTATTLRFLGKASAGHHFYWTIDFLRVDPRQGSLSQLQRFIEAAHTRGIKVILDLALNQLGVINDEQGRFGYRPPTTHPHRDAEGNPVDPRELLDPARYRDIVEYPYHRGYEGREQLSPRWLRKGWALRRSGDFAEGFPESILFCDTFYLAKLFHEHPAVRWGLGDVALHWMLTGFDGFRYDTANHLFTEFFAELNSLLKRAAQQLGRDGFPTFGEAFTQDSRVLAEYVHRGQLDGMIDFPLQAALADFVAGLEPAAVRDLDGGALERALSGGAGVVGLARTDPNGWAVRALHRVLSADALFTNQWSDALQLLAVLSSHDDAGHLAGDLRHRPGAIEEHLVARVNLGYSLVFTLPRVAGTYGGDEQGQTGRPSRDDPAGLAAGRAPTFAAAEGSPYLAQPLIGTDRTNAEDTADANHPIYRHIAALSELRRAVPALRDGAHVPRITDNSRVFAFSRVGGTEADPAGFTEHVVLANPTTTPQTVTVPTYTGGLRFVGRFGADGPVVSGADRTIQVLVPPLSLVVYQGAAPITAPAAAPTVQLDLAPPARFRPPFEKNSHGDARGAFGALVAWGDETDSPARVRFWMRPVGTQYWTPLGATDRAPYQVYPYVDQFAPGTQLEVRVAMTEIGQLPPDDAGEVPARRTAMDTVVVPAHSELPPAPSVESFPPNYALVHYYRSDGDYDGWRMQAEVVDSIAEPVDVPFTAESGYGRFAWVKLHSGAPHVRYRIVHDRKGVDGEGVLATRDGRALWRRSGDATVYASPAEAQGYVTIHRTGTNHQYQGLHLFGGVHESERTVWPDPRPFTGRDLDGAAYARVRIDLSDGPVRFSVITDSGGQDGGDRVVTAGAADAWVRPGDDRVFYSQAEARDEVVIRLNVADGEPDDVRLVQWGGEFDDRPMSAPDGRAPTGHDGFGPYWVVRRREGAPEFSFVFRRGGEDLTPVETLDLGRTGHVVHRILGAPEVDFHDVPVPFAVVPDEPGPALPPLTIVHVSSEYPGVGAGAGGMGTMVVGLAHEQAKAGHIVWVVSRQPFGSDRPTEVVVDQVTDEAAVNVLLVALPDEARTKDQFEAHPEKWSRTTGAAMSSDGLDWLLRLGIDPQIVHMHDSLATEGGFAIAERFSAKTVYTVHALESGRWAGWIYENLDSDAAGDVTKRTITGNEWSATRRAHAVIANSNRMRRETNWVNHVSKQKITVLPNFTSPQWAKFDRSQVDRAATRQSRGIPVDARLILYFGRLENEKGVQDIIAALPDVTPAPDVQTIFGVIGEGTYGHELQLQASALTDAGGNSMADDVRFYGKITPEEGLIDFVVSADLVIFPSHYEPYGLVVNEVAVTGTPQITSDQPALGVDGVNMRVYPAGDRKALAHAINDAFANRKATERMAAEAERQARSSMYKAANVAARTVDVYWSALQESTPVEVGRPWIPGGNLFNVARVHYTRADGDYSRVRLMPLGFGEAPREPMIDSDGAYWEIPFEQHADRVRFTVQDDGRPVEVDGVAELTLPVRPGKAGNEVWLSDGSAAIEWPPGLRLDGAGPDGPIRLAGGSGHRVPTSVGTTRAVLTQRWRAFTGEKPDEVRIVALATEIDATRRARLAAHHALTADLRRLIEERDRYQERLRDSVKEARNWLRLPRVADERATDKDMVDSVVRALGTTDRALIVAWHQSNLDEAELAVRAERRRIREIQANLPAHPAWWARFNPGAEPSASGEPGSAPHGPGGVTRTSELHHELVRRVVPGEWFSDATKWGRTLDGFAAGLEPGHESNCVSYAIAHHRARHGEAVPAEARTVDAYDQARLLEEGQFGLTDPRLDGEQFGSGRIEAVTGARWQEPAGMGPGPLTRAQFKSTLDALEAHLKAVEPLADGSRHATVHLALIYPSGQGGHAIVVEYDRGENVPKGQRGVRYFNVDERGVKHGRRGRPTFVRGGLAAVNLLATDGYGKAMPMPGWVRGRANQLPPTGAYASTRESREQWERELAAQYPKGIRLAGDPDPPARGIADDHVRDVVPTTSPPSRPERAPGPAPQPADPTLLAAGRHLGPALARIGARVRSTHMGHGNPPAPTVWVEVDGRSSAVTVTSAPVLAGRTFEVRSSGAAHVIRLRPGLGEAAAPVLAEALSSIRWNVPAPADLDPAARTIRDEDAVVEHEQELLADELARGDAPARIVERLEQRLRGWQLSRTVERRRLDDRTAPDPGLVLEPAANAAEHEADHQAALARLAELLSARPADPRADLAAAAAQLLRAPMFRHGSDGVSRGLLRVVGSELFATPLLLPSALDAARDDFADWFAQRLPAAPPTAEAGALLIGETALVAATRAAHVTIASRDLGPLGVEYQLLGDGVQVALTVSAEPLPDTIPYALGAFTASNVYTVRLNSRPMSFMVEDAARPAMTEVLRSAGLAADVLDRPADPSLRDAAALVRDAAREAGVPVLRERRHGSPGHPVLSLAVEGRSHLDVLLTSGPLWRPGAVAVQGDSGSGRYTVRLNGALTDRAARAAALTEALTEVLEHAASGTGELQSILGRRPVFQPMLFRARQFPVRELRLASPDELPAAERHLAEEQSAAASVESVALQADLTDASEPDDVAAAFERAYQRLADTHEALAMERRHRGSRVDAGPVATYGVIPSDDPDSPAARTRRDADEIIRRRFAAPLAGQRPVDEVTRQNLVELPDGEQVEGTRLILGGSAAPRLSFVSAAAPAQQRRMHDAAIGLVADLFLRSAVVDPARLVADFSRAAYLLYQSLPPQGAATDAARAFLVVAGDFLLAEALTLPQDVDVQAQTRPQLGTRTTPGFVEWLAAQLPPPIAMPDGG